MTWHHLGGFVAYLELASWHYFGWFPDETLYGFMAWDGDPYPHTASKLCYHVLNLAYKKGN